MCLNIWCNIFLYKILRSKPTLNFKYRTGRQAMSAAAADAPGRLPLHRFGMRCALAMPAEHQLEKDMKEEERIFGIDLDTCTPAQWIWYEDKQQTILEQIAARRRNRQQPWRMLCCKIV